MSEESVEMVRSVYALGLGTDAIDIAFGEYLSDDFELRLPAIYPDPEIHRGREGLIRWSRTIDETWGEWRFEPERFHDAGDRVLVLARIVAEGAASGVPLDREVAHLWSVRDERLTSVEVYLDRDQALDAVGLRE